MSLTDTLKNPLPALTSGGLNRYRLDISSCTASLDVEEFSGKEFMSELYHYDIIFTSSEQINQYRENDLAFIKRLLAEVGIFYFFTLQPDTQTEVVHFADKQSAWAFGKSLPLSSPSGMNDNAADSVCDVQV